ncbi:hypothetical protein MMC07_004311 [Pseudocyphellaria aurata]|nr:hypothetical protein [Pseudocyphellaria aurata]
MAALEPLAEPSTRPCSSFSASFSAQSANSPSSAVTSSAPPSSSSLSASDSSSSLSPWALWHRESSSTITNHTRVQNLIAGLATKGITVTEWGSVLLSRLDVPVSIVDYDFLVADDLLEAACSFTEEQGYGSIESPPILLDMYGKWETVARHFDCFGQRVNLFPASFAGFRADELITVSLDLGHLTPAMPVTVLTTKVAPLAASFVRNISRIPRRDRLRSRLLHDLVQVLSYNLFDMSYEGDYMVLGEETQEDIDRQITRGLNLFRKLEGWRDDEMWIADALEAIVHGKGHYDDLPASDSQSQ